ncbi:hypothetical protein [Actinobacillus pleuropneumoniae]|uniref:LysR family transcriptional regulator n=1 Tax=Actinobacillus pleuropneumoniae TaxID=715 RepID=A0ABM6X3J2_ACTPL|nr:hypothetical protein [Actinobacillus pleuropneumoniae]UKH32942.1 LysR family transcriptional regulator [Actinobacillus pleuropneumoniae serovar 10 str. D13039]AWG95502.1 LysR family transcriptional regulator [Actinobacillus pleuropneumoniae serovar 1 str. 4074]AXA21573.1 LysR family transcriptional regulator [Actinobacillus pleuropneumoniae]EFM94055.1 Transcriptional regulator, LysR family [Actinobacillus pleuropneumoniae serovar 9 str. CVJ13261]EFM98199.1 Transcriptional regulator, LysR fa
MITVSDQLSNLVNDGLDCTLRLGELVPILTELQTPTLPLWIIYPQRQFIPKRLAVFIEWLMTLAWNE